MVGTLEPRKGHSQVLEAFDLLWQRKIDVKLIIVGREGWKVDELIIKLKSHPENSNRLFWLSDIDDSRLGEIYSEADAIIFPSYGEGFGLPLVEAALHEKPIIARNLAIFNEVAGDCAYYFDANDAEQLFEAMQSWIELYKENKHPKTANMTWLTWKQSAEQLLKAVGL